MGAHCYQADMNRHSIGICLVGDFDEEVPSLSQEITLRGLVSALIGKHGIPLTNLKYHRDYAPKSCPGANIGKDYLIKILTPEKMTKRELVEALYRQLNQKPTEEEITQHMLAPNWDILLSGFFQAKENQTNKKVALQLNKIKTWVESGKKILDNYNE